MLLQNVINLNVFCASLSRFRWSWVIMEEVKKGFGPLSFILPSPSGFFGVIINIILFSFMRFTFFLSPAWWESVHYILSFGVFVCWVFLLFCSSANGNSYLKEIKFFRVNSHRVQNGAGGPSSSLFACLAIVFSF